MFIFGYNQPVLLHGFYEDVNANVLPEISDAEAEHEDISTR